MRRKLVQILRESIGKIKKGLATDDDKKWATECALRIEDAI